MGAHLIDGEFQSDKYPTCPRGNVPLSTKDPAAQDLIYLYAQRRRVGSHGSREADVVFADDAIKAVRLKGFGCSPRECFFCPDCGIDVKVKVDDDGCCATCGRDCAAIAILVEPEDMSRLVGDDTDDTVQERARMAVGNPDQGAVLLRASPNEST